VVVKDVRPEVIQDQEKACLQKVTEPDRLRKTLINTLSKEEKNNPKVK
jgi:hypothetical protein